MTKPLNHSHEIVKLCADQLRAPISSPYLSRPMRTIAEVKRAQRDTEAQMRGAKVIPFPEPKGFGQACIDRARADTIQKGEFPRGWQFADTSVEEHGRGQF